MEGVTINGVDLEEYGTILLSGAYAELLKPAEPKEWVSNEDPRKNGTEYLAPAEQKYKERDVTLTFGIKGENKDDFISKYTSFISAINDGIIKLQIEELGRYYYLIFQSCTSFDNYDLKACKLSVKFIEPDPTNNGA